jgi:GH35 family endo-1,4-beta-xylanase
MRCVEKTQRTSTQGYGEPKPVDTEEVRLVPVTGEENKEWSRWTPSGEVKMQITNPEALNQFTVGADYFVDFTPA